MKKLKTILVIILVLVVLLAFFGSLGYFGGKAMRRSHLRSAARDAFAAEDWKTAEKLLNEYVEKDPDSEDDFVRLAQVCRRFGDTDKEMHCWYRASMLNPLKPEYWDNYTGCALSARNFGHLYTTLNRRLGLGETLAPKDKILYLISMVRTNRVKESEQFYSRMLKDEPGIFQQDELSRFAEFLVTNNRLTPGERSFIIEQNIKSDDPVVRLESTLLYLIDLEFSGEDEDSIYEKEETMLKQLVESNRFAVIPFLASVYFSQLKFNDLIEVAEPYLADIENFTLSVLYAESCVYSVQPEKLKALAEDFHSRGPNYRWLAAYFDALTDFMEGVEKNEDLAAHMQIVRDSVRTDLANLVNLQIALNSDNLDKILGYFETIMKSPPFFDLQKRAWASVRHYLGLKVEEDPALAEDMRVVKLAQILSASDKTDKTDPFLMRIAISDMRKRNVLTPQIIQEYLDAFPMDPYFLQVAAEFELFSGDPEKCLEYTERFYALKDEKRSTTFDLLHMLALELTGKIDEAAKEYAALVDNTEMNRGILFRYFRFCIDHKLHEELSRTAERLDASDVPELKSLAPFFRVESLLLQKKTEEALSLLETTKTDHPDFAFRAANLCSAFDLPDQALSRYLALVGKYRDERSIFANIAEVYAAKGMNAEALSYAKQAWETNPDDPIGQFVYAKMLAANGKYQDAERVLKMPRRQVDLPGRLKELWTDIMLHCVREDWENGQHLRVLDRTNHYLILYPDDPVFLEFRTRVEQELKKKPDSDSQEPEP